MRVSGITTGHFTVKRLEAKVKRIGLKQEFHGEPDPCAEEWMLEAEGHDEVVLDVAGGCVSFVVPSNVPDDQVLEKNLADRFICCNLKLENGAELSVWINEGASGVDVRLLPGKKSRVKAAAGKREARPVAV
jgi:hypothetical protein